MSASIRLLTPDDALVFRNLRLRALETDGSAFLSDWELEKQKALARFSQELVFTSLQPPFGYYGYFVDDVLVGYVQIGWSGLVKQRHVAFLYNLYFDPLHRGRGYSAQLVEYLFSLLRANEVECVVASCLASNQKAFQFYQRMGFTEYGRREGTVKWQGNYDDEVELIKKLT